MKKSSLQLVVLLILSMLMIAGCGGSSGTSDNTKTNGKGTMALAIDLQTLTSKSAAKSVQAIAPAITSATIELTRAGYLSITQDMTISNNIASCQIDNLELGYWHVTVHIFRDTTEIYSGSSDANILPDVVAHVNILFEPSVLPSSTGSVAITAGINPMPGYTAINQKITNIFQDPIGGKLYIYDATTLTIGVYISDTMARTSDITLASAPTTLAQTVNKDALLLGYSSGQIYQLNLSTGATTLIGDTQMNVKSILAMGNRIALISSQGEFLSSLKTLDLVTGQVLDTKESNHAFSNFIFNQVNGLVYTSSNLATPVEMFRIRVDLTTGVISEIASAPNPGNHHLGEPRWFINNGSQLIAEGGNVFSSSSIAEQDLVYSKELGITVFNDLAVDETQNRIYVVQDIVYPLLLIKVENALAPRPPVQLFGSPRHVFVTPTKVIVMTSLNSLNYAKVFDKSGI